MEKGGLKLPEGFIGGKMKACGYTKTEPRRWTEEELQWCIQCVSDGYTYKQIAEATGRTETNVSVKMKRLQKKTNDYNRGHIADKYETNKKFIDIVRPKTILDVYCGENSFYKNHAKDSTVVTNDINDDIEADYHMDALKFLCQMYIDKKKFDVVDLDPFGSAYDCFDLAIKMAKKGLVVTLGEMGHKRWKRFDFVRNHYGIDDVDDFTSDKMIEKIQNIGRCNKRDLVVEYKKDWQNISRVWFRVERIKVTEQWSKE